MKSREKIRSIIPVTTNNEQSLYNNVLEISIGDINAIRKQFLCLTTGKVYFYHAAISPMPNFVKVKLEQFLHERSATDIDIYEKMVATVGSLTNKLAVMLNAKPDIIVLTKSVSFHAKKNEQTTISLLLMT